MLTQPYLSKVAEDPLSVFAQPTTATGKRKGDSEVADEKSGKRAKSDAKTEAGADGKKEGKV